MPDSKNKPKVEVGRWGAKGSRTSSRPTPGANPLLNHLEVLAWLLDDSIRLPWLGIRIGVDSLLGIIPVIGDSLGALFSSYILFMAAKMGVPRVTLLRMGFNIAVDAAVGLVPFLGDFFDFAWKANLKNVVLIRAHLEDPEHSQRADWLFAGLFILGVAGVLALAAWAALSLGKMLTAAL